MEAMGGEGGILTPLGLHLFILNTHNSIWQIAEKRREATGKGERERYTHLNAEFQRIASRGKRALRSEQCKETEENNKIEKTRDLLKKIRGIKGTLHAQYGTIKDKNGKDVTEPEEIKKRWQEYTEELYKMIQITTMGWSLT